MKRRRGFEVAAWLAKRTRQERGGNARKPDAFDRGEPDSLALWRDRYLESLSCLNYAANTVKVREHTINLFLTWAAERDLKRASEVTRPMLEAYQRWLCRYTRPNGRRLGWGIQRQRIGSLKEWFRWLTKQNVLLHNPASEIELPRMEKRLPGAALTLEQVAALMNVPDVGDPLGVRDRAMLELFYSSGLRRMELRHLEMADLSAARRSLTIRRGKGGKDRVVPVGERALFWIERYLREVRPRLCLDTRTQALFLTVYGEAFSPDVLSRMVGAWLKQTGASGSCHLLRHTCATHMLEGGADIRYIQQLLGHENLDTTAIYTEVSIRQLQEVHRRCHPSGSDVPVVPQDGPAPQAPPGNVKA